MPEHLRDRRRRTARSALGTPRPRAAHFAKEVVQQRRRRRGRRRPRAPTRRSWWSAASRSSTAARPTTAPPWRSARASRSWSRPCGRPTRNTVVVLEDSYPTTIGVEQATSRRSCGPPTRAPRPGHALADVLFGDYNPAGRLTQTWYRSDADLPSILDYDVIGSRRDLPVLPRARRSTRSATACRYTTFRYGGVTVSAPRRRPCVRRQGHQHRPARRRRGRPALHPPAQLARDAAGQAAARLRARHLAPRRDETVR